MVKLSELRSEYKNKLILALCVILCVLCLVSSFGATYAYLVDSETKRNQFVVGETVTTMTEDYEPPKVLEPGITFKKTPKIMNTGNLDCFIRMRIDFSDSRMAKYCTLTEVNTTDWEYNSTDGYYYYKHILKPNETATPLFTGVAIASTYNGVALTTADMYDFDVLIYSESRQHVDHTGTHAANEHMTVWSV